MSDDADIFNPTDIKFNPEQFSVLLVSHPDVVVDDANTGIVVTHREPNAVPVCVPLESVLEALVGVAHTSSRTNPDGYRSRACNLAVMLIHAATLVALPYADDPEFNITLPKPAKGLH